MCASLRTTSRLDLKHRGDAMTSDQLRRIAAMARQRRLHPEAAQPEEVPPLTERNRLYVRARDRARCKRKYDGCTNSCDILELAVPLADLQATRRDPGNPDNWCCVCTHCAQPVEPGS
jgi:hypothetical protein